MEGRTVNEKEQDLIVSEILIPVINDLKIKRFTVRKSMLSRENQGCVQNVSIQSYRGSLKR